MRTADEQLGRLFPAGKPAPGQYVFWILGDDDERFGSIWIGEAIGAHADSWWMWNIRIDESARQHGALRTLEAEVGEQASGTNVIQLRWPSRSRLFW